MKTIWILLSFCGFVCAQPELAEDLTYEDLVRIIKEKDIRTPQDLVAALPPHYFETQHHALAYETGSDHDATTEKPRTVYAGKKAKTLIAVSGGEDPKKIAMVEVIQSRDDCRQSEFRVIDFDPEGKKKPTFSDPNPRRCNVCHHGKPIWDHYQAWPFFYGSAPNGYVPLKEINGWVKFSKSFKNDPRYSKLKIEPREAEENPTQMFGHSVHNGADAITHSLSKNNSKRVAHLIKSVPGVEPYAFAVLGALVGCEDMGAFFPAPANKEVQALRDKFKTFYDKNALEEIHHKNARQMHGETNKEGGSIGGIPDVSYNHTGTQENARQLASLAAVLRPLGADMRYWSLSKHEPITSFKDAFGETFFYKTMQYVEYHQKSEMLEVQPEGVMKHFQKELKLKDLESVINSPKKMRKYAEKHKIETIDKYGVSKYFTAQCDFLAKRSITRINKMVPDLSTSPWMSAGNKHFPNLNSKSH